MIKQVPVWLSIPRRLLQSGVVRHFFPHGYLAYRQLRRKSHKTRYDWLNIHSERRLQSKQPPVTNETTKNQHRVVNYINLMKDRITWSQSVNILTRKYRRSRGLSVYGIVTPLATSPATFLQNTREVDLRWPTRIWQVGFSLRKTRMTSVSFQYGSSEWNVLKGGDPQAIALLIR